MKKIFNFLYAVILLSIASACGNTETLDPVGQWTLEPSTLESPEQDANLELSETVVQDVVFRWTEATSSAGYSVTYKLQLVPAENDTIVWLEQASDNMGKATQISLSHKEIDYAMSAVGIDISTTVAMKWKVIASSIDKIATSSQAISIKRLSTEAPPENLYLVGAATEAGDNASNAILLNLYEESNGTSKHIHELFTKLEGGKDFMFYSGASDNALKYGGENGTIKKNGEAIQVAETGTYQIRVNMISSTYDIVKIDQLGIVGNVTSGGWGADAVFEYQGGSIWKQSVVFSPQDEEAPRFIIRANAGWDMVFKRVKGTQNQLIVENDPLNGGIEIEDIPVEEMGKYFVTLDFSTRPYTYTLEKDNSLVPPTSTPEQLFLLADGTLVKELTKDGDVFRSEVYVALEASKTYTLNTAADGSGTTYTVSDVIGGGSGDNVTGNTTFGEGGEGVLAVSNDQMYQLNIDFAKAIVGWKYYNFKLFHWKDWGTDKIEFEMTYAAPNTFTLTADLIAGSDMKFNSPWDLEMGSDTPAELSGNLINKGGENIKCITEDGTYTVTITVTEDFATGTYEFVKQ